MFSSPNSHFNDLHQDSGTDLLAGLTTGLLLFGFLTISVPSAPAQSFPPASQLSDSVTQRLLDSETTNNSLSNLELENLPQPIPSPSTFNLEHLILLPNLETIAWLDRQFAISVAPLNSRIELRQDMLLELLSQPSSSDGEIREVQSILSQLRSERDRMAIEHLLLVRQLSEEGKLPRPSEQSLIGLD